MTRPWLARGLLAMSVGALAAAPALAQFKGVRPLSEAEQHRLMSALLADPQMPMSEDPSCKADLSRPGRVSVSEALGAALARAAAAKARRVVQLDCFQRPGYPMKAGQEYCRLAFVPPARRTDGGFGLLFLMDWPSGAVVADSPECY